MNALTFTSKALLSLLLIFLLIFLNTIFLLQPLVFKTIYPFLTETDSYGWSSTKQLEYSSQIAHYLNKGLSFTDTNIELSSTEVSHMNDVAQIIRFVKLGAALLFSFLVSITWKLYRKKLLNRQRISNYFKQSLIFYALIMSTLCLITFFFWSHLFTLMHLILFPQGNWTFFSESTLIRLFPDLFWQKILLIVVIGVFLEIGSLYSFVRFMSKTQKPRVLQ